jgi:hypothetical protein
MRKMSLAALMLFLIVIAASPTSAQVPAGDSWKVTVIPYFMGAGMSGTTTVAGQEVTVDASFSDIVNNLQFGAMGLVIARKGNWGFGGDAIWMALGANGEHPLPGGTPISASVDVNQGAFAFYGLRRLGPAADLTFGGRVNVLQADVKLTGPLADRSASGSKTWFDPLVGVILHTPENGKRWHAQVYTEIGGFGVGSSFTWQVFPTFGVDLSQHISVEFGYRWLDIDYTSGADNTLFKWDVLTQGPVMGFGFRF